MRIYLIGFMGSGKTFWGQKLSEQLRIPCFDLDAVIEGSEKKSVQQIFHEDGEEYFRTRENEILQALTDEHTAMILSTGGGTPCFFNNIDYMKQKGRVVWLNTGVDALVQRLLKQKHSRPLIKNIPDADLKAFIIKKLQDRKLYYEQADIILDEETITIDSLLKTLAHA